ncbi:hypothetical protein F4703DRAFT_1790266 [Phycomyces blakesleeanus]
MYGYNDLLVISARDFEQKRAHIILVVFEFSDPNLIPDFYALDRATLRVYSHFRLAQTYPISLNLSVSIILYIYVPYPVGHFVTVLYTPQLSEIQTPQSRTDTTIANESGRVTSQECNTHQALVHFTLLQ